jgi:hypothetical protein
LNDKIKSPLWAAVALILGFTGGNVAGQLDTGEKVTAKPIYDQPLVWQITSTPQGDHLAIKSFSSLGFPAYTGKISIALPNNVKKELRSLVKLKAGAVWRGSVVTQDRAALRVDDKIMIADKSPLLARAFILKNLEGLCVKNAGLCEPAPQEIKK